MQRIQNFSYRHTVRLVWLFVGAYSCVVFGLLLYKYTSFGFNGIDLGIYGQVFFNSASGHLFQLSIHPNLYLGDHFELFILALLPFFKAIPSVLTLLFLQTVSLAIGAVPLFAIARTRLNRHWSLFITLAYLMSPFVLNMNFFEFHLLPFAIPFLLGSIYFYLQKKIIPFLVISSVALIVREDVALVIALFGVLALVDRRNWRWVLAPLIMGGAWFAIAYSLIGYFNHSGSYKFLSMYAWLGSTPSAMITTALTKPWIVLRQIVDPNNIFLAIGLLLPLVGLPLLKSRYLIPAALIAVQLFLAGVSATIVLQTHYTALLLPFLFVSAAFGLVRLLEKWRGTGNQKMPLLSKRGLLLMIIIIAPLYSLITFSPMITGFQQLLNNASHRGVASLEHDIVQQVGTDESVVASFDFLAPLSQRKNLYSLHYAFIGQRQFSHEPFEIPVALNTAVIDFTDFTTYYLQSQNIDSYRQQYATGSSRINTLLEKNNLRLTTIADSYALYKKNQTPGIQLIEREAALPVDLHVVNKNSSEPVALIGWAPINGANPYGLIPLALYWQANGQVPADYQFDFSIVDTRDRTVYHKYYPIGYGLSPPTQWAAGEMVKTNHWFFVPKEFQNDSYRLELQIVDVHGYMGLDGWRRATPEITERLPVGSATTINYWTR